MGYEHPPLRNLRKLARGERADPGRLLLVKRGATPNHRALWAAWAAATAPTDEVSDWWERWPGEQNELGSLIYQGWHLVSAWTALESDISAAAKARIRALARSTVAMMALGAVPTTHGERYAHGPTITLCGPRSHARRDGRIGPVRTYTDGHGLFARAAGLPWRLRHDDPSRALEISRGLRLGGPLTSGEEVTVIAAVRGDAEAAAELIGWVIPDHVRFGPLHILRCSDGSASWFSGADPHHTRVWVPACSIVGGVYRLMGAARLGPTIRDGELVSATRSIPIPTGEILWYVVVDAHGARRVDTPRGWSGGAPAPSHEPQRALLVALLDKARRYILQDRLADAREPVERVLSSLPRE